MFSSVFKRFGRLFLLCSFVFALFLPALVIAEEGNSILLTFTGDCTLGGQEWLKDYDFSFVSYIKQHGFAYPFAKVKSLFEEDDLTIINLENVFYDKVKPAANKNYLFRSPTEFARILPEGSIEVAFVGNNHILDYGTPGLNSTLAALAEQGVAHFGSVNGLDASYVYEKDGIKIGFMGSYRAYWYFNRKKVEQNIQSLREAGCQVIIYIIHDGMEYSPVRVNAQQSMATWLVDRGIDLIIGHHPHVPQGVDILGDATVLYSLGNFSFGGNKSLDISRRPGRRADRALLARVELRFDKQDAYTGHQVRLIPVSPSGVSEYNNYQPVILTGEEALATMALVQADTAFPLPPYQEGIGVLMDFLPVAQPIESADSSPATP